MCEKQFKKIHVKRHSSTEGDCPLNENDTERLFKYLETMDDRLMRIERNQLIARIVMSTAAAIAIGFWWVLEHSVQLSDLYFNVIGAGRK